MHHIKRNQNCDKIIKEKIFTFNVSKFEKYGYYTSNCSGISLQYNITKCTIRLSTEYSIKFIINKRLSLLSFAYLSYQFHALDALIVSCSAVFTKISYNIWLADFYKIGSMNYKRNICSLSIISKCYWF